MASGSGRPRSARLSANVSAFAVLFLVLALVQALPAQAKSGPSLDSAGFGPVVRESLHNDLSAPLSSMQAAPFRTATGHPREVPMLQLPKALDAGAGSGTGSRVPGQSLRASAVAGSMPAFDASFEGTANIDGVLPPDTEGDVGPNHYVQWINLSIGVWDKDGNLLLGPIPGNSLWSGFGGACETHNDGDPIVLYDHLADRWMLSQFALFAPDGHHQCIAISRRPATRPAPGSATTS